MSLTKQQLEALNNNSFPNNNAGYITPDILRTYNAAVIDALVDSNDTGSFATTGSNTFVGAQTITGSNGRLQYSGTNLSDTSLASIHANDSNPWLERFYNDSFSTSSAVMAYFAWDDGRFIFHNESTESIGIGVNGDYNNPELLVYQDKAVIKNDLFISGNVYATNLTGSGGGNIDTGSFATTGSNTFIGDQTIVGNVTFPSGSFIASTNVSGNLYFSALNGGILHLNDDGGEGDVLVGYVGSVGKLKVKTDSEFTGSISQTGTFYADQIDVSRGGIIQTTGSYVMTYSSSGLVTYDTYENVAAALQPYISGSGGTIDTGSFATTGSNSFTGSQTILSGAIGILNNGNSTSITDTELSIETNGTPAASYIVSFNQTASAAVISYDGATYDNELWTIADSAGIRMTDWDNGIGNISAVPFLSIGANDGSQPPPQFNRGLSVSGSIQMQLDSTIKFHQLSSSVGFQTSALRFYTEPSSSTNNRWLNMQAVPNDAGANVVALSDFPTNNHFQYYDLDAHQIRFEAAIRVETSGSGAERKDIEFYTNTGSIRLQQRSLDDSGHGDVVITSNPYFGTTNDTSSLTISSNNGADGDSPFVNLYGIYPGVNVNTDSVKNAYNGVFAGFQSQDLGEGKNYQTFFGAAANSYTPEYGGYPNGETVGWIGGGANNSNGSNTAFIMRTGSAELEVFKPIVANYEVKLTSGSNQQTGLATLNGGNPGTATISNSLVNSNSIILLTKQTNNHPNSGPVNVSSKGSGTFTITSNHNGDTDVVAFMIINPS